MLKDRVYVQLTNGRVTLCSTMLSLYENHRMRRSRGNLVSMAVMVFLAVIGPLTICQAGLRVGSLEGGSSAHRKLPENSLFICTEATHSVHVLCVRVA